MKKKANVITVHVGANFGSNLQTIATCETLKKLQINPLVINYIPFRVTWRGYFSNLHGLNLIRKLYSAPNKLINDFIYARYLSKYCDVSNPIYPWDNFSAKCPQTDIYVTGSDQVWNSNYNGGIDFRYFWGGIKGKKIAYAASIGNNGLSDEEKLKFPKYLSEYAAVSVREESAKEALEDLGISSMHVLDPTFMLDRNEWKKYATNRKIKEPYLLVYLPYNTVDVNLTYRTIRKIAKLKGLKIISFSWHYWADKFADITIKYANPGDFLALMIHADYVVTNSFHGTAFSINLNKQFCVYLPSNFSTRLISLLDLCHIRHRLLSDEITIEQIGEVIDYDGINQILLKEKEKAFNFLKESLK